VENTGERAGDEVVQLYTRQRRSRVKQPLRQLRGFARVSLAPGECRTVRLRLRAADLAHWDVAHDDYLVETARHTVSIGRSCLDVTLTATLAVRGTAGGADRHDEPAPPAPAGRGHHPGERTSAAGRTGVALP
jgi:beta-glucosidase